MKRLLVPFLLLTLFALASCGPATPSANPSDEPEPDIFPRATITPSALNPETAPDTGYPLPTPSAPPSGYPASQEAYPVGGNEALVWLIRPVGVQCEERNEEDPADLQTAVSDLAAKGVTVHAAELTQLAVCTACGCPTSAHFRVQINAQDLPKAEALGWQKEE
ncbi:MAG: hypothetical protein D6706_18045 [Chloroflexi bacterium]|nr:MAG: hypothetical protein D6706_18045 [Chloroflexota bacterium]